MSYDLIETFRERLSQAGMFLDFDGTLSEIVERPEDARPVQGVPRLLEELSVRCKLVAIVSGRSAHQLVEWLGPGVEIWGVHGAEVARGGVVSLSAEAAPFGTVMAEAKSRLRDRLDSLDHPGVMFEDKGVVANAHYRSAPDPDAARTVIEQIVREIAETYALEVGHGRMTLEIKPRADFSKEKVVRLRAEEEGLGAAAFIGDDTVDLPAFDALDDLATRGVGTLRVAVSSNESDPELLRRADVVVDGPSGVLEFLRGILA